MHDTDQPGCNLSDNPALTDLIEARVSRRSVLGGGLAAAAVGFLGGGVLNAASVVARPRHLLGFTEVPTSSADTLVVPEGYTAQVVIPWGTPLFAAGPAWNKDASNTAAEQAQQVGMHHDGMHFFPIGDRHPTTRGLLVLNHEYVDQILLNADGATPITAEKVAKALAAHGVTVIEIQLTGDTWTQVDSPYNRRITGVTPVAFSGPVSADHPELQSNNPPMGTLNNCAHGKTPWGTYLTCEENWNGYFGT
ncbi:MAG: PhoX family protein, partial [Acidimicrobiales bacterium]